MPKYVVGLVQYGTGRLIANVEVEAETPELAEEAAKDHSDIPWEVCRFSGDGYECVGVEEVG